MDPFLRPINLISVPSVSIHKVPVSSSDFVDKHHQGLISIYMSAIGVNLELEEE